MQFSRFSRIIALTVGMAALFPAVPVFSAGRLRFSSGFEEEVYISRDGEDIKGSDGMSWEEDLEGYPEVHKWCLSFIGRSPEYAFADLRNDPTGRDNRVLYFQLNDNDPGTDATTRTQSGFHFKREGDRLFRQGFVRYRVYWHPDLMLLKEYPRRIAWFQVMEWWEHRNPEKQGGIAGQCRWSLSLNKESGSDNPPYWAISAQYMQPPQDEFKPIWPMKSNKKVPVPIGKWAVLEIFFRKGHGSDGRIWVAITPEGGKPQVVFDIHDHTEHPKDPLPIRAWQHFKLYTSDEILDWMRARGARVRAYYDDFEWWDDFPPQEVQAVPLHEAARLGDLAAVESLIENDAEVNARDVRDNTALHYAAKEGHREVAEALLASGSSTNVRNVAGDTPIHYAAKEGHENITELLIGAAANLNERNNIGQTPLELAVGRNHRSVAKLLIEKGADVNAGKELGRGVLHDAVTRGQREIAELLLSKGADVNAKDKWGYSPLTYAMARANRDMGELLIEAGADIEGKDSFGYTALHWVVMMGNEEITKFLLDKGADVNTKSNDGETPLDVATHGSPRGVGELLIEKGAEVSTLHTAAYVGDLEKVKSFIEKGEHINGQNTSGGTPLHAAAAGGRGEILEFLIEKGADINVKDKSDRTPLHRAAEAGQKDAAEWLLSHGADANSKSNGGFTALHYAAMSGDRDVTELFLAKGCNVNEETTRGSTPLHCAALVGSKEVVELLIAKGAEVNAKNNRGQSPLTLAKQRGHDEIVGLLLKQGAKE